MKTFVVTISMGDSQQHIRIIKKTFSFEFEGEPETYPSLITIIEEGLKKKQGLTEIIPCPGWPFGACFSKVDNLR